MKILLILTLSFMLSACVSTPPGSIGSGLYTVPVGSIVKLNQPLTIPGNKARTGVQFGKATISVNQYEPYCEFLVNTIKEKTITLPAGDYRVTRVRRYEIPIAGSRPSGGTMVASSSESTAWAAQAIAPANDWLYTTAFRLESNAHPDIRQLECGNAFPAGYMMTHHITMNEFESLAGDILTLQLVGN